MILCFYKIVSVVNLDAQEAEIDHFFSLCGGVGPSAKEKGKRKGKRTH